MKIGSIADLSINQIIAHGEQNIVSKVTLYQEEMLNVIVFKFSKLPH